MLTEPTTETSPSKSSAPAGANETVRNWVFRYYELCKPDRVVWCDGSAQERAQLLAQGVREGVLIQLNQEKLPNCYLHRSNPNDVSRTEQVTFICTPSEDMAGPTNNWMEPRVAYAKLREMFDGCMRGRTMYV